MADSWAHLLQARANEALAASLLTSNHDWAVTATFYAALHFFECWLSFRTERHTETQTSQNTSAHAWRNRFLARTMRSAHTPYSFLYQRSQLARYLSMQAPNAGIPAQSLVSAADAAYCLRNRLHQLKQALKLDLVELMMSVNASDLAVREVLTSFPNPAALQSASVAALQVKLSPVVFEELRTKMAAQGKSFGA